MTLNEYDYQIWRKALHDHQVQIDNFDNDFWQNVIDNNIEGAQLEELQKLHDQDRKVLTDGLEAIYQQHPKMN